MRRFPIQSTRGPGVTGGDSPRSHSDTAPSSDGHSRSGSAPRPHQPAAATGAFDGDVEMHDRSQSLALDVSMERANVSRQRAALAAAAITGAKLPRSPGMSPASSVTSMPPQTVLRPRSPGASLTTAPTAPFFAMGSTTSIPGAAARLVRDGGPRPDREEQAPPLAQPRHMPAGRLSGSGTPSHSQSQSQSQSARSTTSLDSSVNVGVGARAKEERRKRAQREAEQDGGSPRPSSRPSPADAARPADTKRSTPVAPPSILKKTSDVGLRSPTLPAAAALARPPYGSVPAAGPGNASEPAVLSRVSSSGGSAGGPPPLVSAMKRTTVTSFEALPVSIDAPQAQGQAQSPTTSPGRKSRIQFNVEAEVVPGLEQSASASGLVDDRPSPDRPGPAMPSVFPANPLLPPGGSPGSPPQGRGNTVTAEAKATARGPSVIFEDILPKQRKSATSFADDPSSAQLDAAKRTAAPHSPLLRSPATVSIGSGFDDPPRSQSPARPAPRNGHSSSIAMPTVRRSNPTPSSPGPIRAGSLAFDNPEAFVNNRAFSLSTPIEKSISGNRERPKPVTVLSSQSDDGDGRGTPVRRARSIVETVDEFGRPRPELEEVDDVACSDADDDDDAQSVYSTRSRTGRGAGEKDDRQSFMADIQAAIDSNAAKQSALWAVRFADLEALMYRPIWWCADLAAVPTDHPDELLEKGSTMVASMLTLFMMLFGMLSWGSVIIAVIFGLVTLFGTVATAAWYCVNKSHRPIRLLALVMGVLFVLANFLATGCRPNEVTGGRAMVVASPTVLLYAPLGGKIWHGFIAGVLHLAAFLAFSIAEEAEAFCFGITSSLMTNKLGLVITEVVVPLFLVFFFAIMVTRKRAEYTAIFERGEEFAETLGPHLGACEFTTAYTIAEEHVQGLGVDNLSSAEELMYWAAVHLAHHNAKQSLQRRANQRLGAAAFAEGGEQQGGPQSQPSVFAPSELSRAADGGDPFGARGPLNPQQDDPLITVMAGSNSIARSVNAARSSTEFLQHDGSKLGGASGLSSAEGNAAIGSGRGLPPRSKSPSQDSGRPRSPSATPPAKARSKVSIIAPEHEPQSLSPSTSLQQPSPAGNSPSSAAAAALGRHDSTSWQQAHYTALEDIPIRDDGCLLSLQGDRLFAEESAQHESSGKSGRQGMLEGESAAPSRKPSAGPFGTGPVLLANSNSGGTTGTADSPGRPVSPQRLSPAAQSPTSLSLRSGRPSGASGAFAAVSTSGSGRLSMARSPAAPPPRGRVGVAPMDPTAFQRSGSVFRSAAASRKSVFGGAGLLQRGLSMTAAGDTPEEEEPHYAQSPAATPARTPQRAVAGVSPMARRSIGAARSVPSTPAAGSAARTRARSVAFGLAPSAGPSPSHAAGSGPGPSGRGSLGMAAQPFQRRRAFVAAFSLPNYDLYCAAPKANAEIARIVIEGYTLAVSDAMEAFGGSVVFTVMTDLYIAFDTPSAAAAAAWMVTDAARHDRSFRDPLSLAVRPHLPVAAIVHCSVLVGSTGAVLGGTQLGWCGFHAAFQQLKRYLAARPPADADDGAGGSMSASMSTSFGGGAHAHRPFTTQPALGADLLPLPTVVCASSLTPFLSPDFALAEVGKCLTMRRVERPLDVGADGYVIVQDATLQRMTANRERSFEGINPEEFLPSRKGSHRRSGTTDGDWDDDDEDDEVEDVNLSDISTADTAELIDLEREAAGTAGASASATTSMMCPAPGSMQFNLDGCQAFGEESQPFGEGSFTSSTPRPPNTGGGLQAFAAVTKPTDLEKRQRKLELKKALAERDRQRRLNAKEQRRLRRGRKLSPEMLEVWERYDVDRNGTLDVDEIGDMLDEMGLQLTQAELEDFFRAIDLDGSGTISQTEFAEGFFSHDAIAASNVVMQVRKAALKLSHLTGADNLQALAAVWAKYDPGESGTLGPPQVQRLLSDLGIVHTLEEIDYLCQRLDGNGNGMIELDELAELFSSQEVMTSKQQQLQTRIATVERVMQSRAEISTENCVTAEQRAGERAVTLGDFVNDFYSPLLFLYILYNFGITLYRIALGDRLDTPTIHVAVDMALDIIYISWFVLKLLYIPREVQGQVFFERMKIISAYVPTVEFAIDVLVSLPADFVYIGLGSPAGTYGFYRVLKLLAVYHLSQQFHHFTRRLNPSATRITNSFILFLLVGHTFACVGILTTRIVGGGDIETIFKATDVFGDMSTLYLQLILWAIQTMTGQIRSDNLPADISVALNICAVLVGIPLFAVFLATIANAINVQTTEAQFLGLIDAIRSYFSYAKHNPSARGADLHGVEEECISYFRHLFDTTGALDIHANPLRDVPMELSVQVTVETGLDMLRKVPIFAEACENVEFVHEMASKLVPHILEPHSLVMLKGQRGTDMYFVTYGECHVITEQGVVVFTIRKGSFFGEIALLHKVKRTATIRCGDKYCNALRLDKRDFDEVMETFPQCLLYVSKSAEGRLKEILAKEAEEQRQKRMQRRTSRVSLAHKDMAAAIESVAKKVGGQGGADGATPNVQPAFHPGDGLEEAPDKMGKLAGIAVAAVNVVRKKSIAPAGVLRSALAAAHPADDEDTTGTQSHSADANGHVAGGNVRAADADSDGGETDVDHLLRSANVEVSPHAGGGHAGAGSAERHHEDPREDFSLRSAANQSSSQATPAARGRSGSSSGGRLNAGGSGSGQSSGHGQSPGAHGGEESLAATSLSSLSSSDRRQASHASVVAAEVPQQVTQSPLFDEAHIAPIGPLQEQPSSGADELPPLPTVAMEAAAAIAASRAAHARAEAALYDSSGQSTPAANTPRTPSSLMGRSGGPVVIDGVAEGSGAVRGRDVTPHRELTPDLTQLPLTAPRELLCSSGRKNTVLPGGPSGGPGGADDDDGSGSYTYSYSYSYSYSDPSDDRVDLDPDDAGQDEHSLGARERTSQAVAAVAAGDQHQVPGLQGRVAPLCPPDLSSLGPGRTHGHVPSPFADGILAAGDDNSGGRGGGDQPMSVEQMLRTVEGRQPTEDLVSPPHLHTVSTASPGDLARGHNAAPAAGRAVTTPRVQRRSTTDSTNTAATASSPRTWTGAPSPLFRSAAQRHSVGALGGRQLTTASVASDVDPADLHATASVVSDYGSTGPDTGGGTTGTARPSSPTALPNAGGSVTSISGGVGAAPPGPHPHPQGGAPRRLPQHGSPLPSPGDPPPVDLPSGVARSGRSKSKSSRVMFAPEEPDAGYGDTTSLTSLVQPSSQAPTAAATPVSGPPVTAGDTL